MTILPEGESEAGQHHDGEAEQQHDDGGEVAATSPAPEPKPMPIALQAPQGQPMDVESTTAHIQIDTDEASYSGQFGRYKRVRERAT
eukprot:11048642-Lingulodinium_polyedra.AAC.1